MSSEQHDNHGQTPAAWTAVIIIMVAFILGCVAVVIAQPWLVAVAAVLIVVGVVVGKVMSMMGLGATHQDPDVKSSTAGGDSGSDDRQPAEKA
jgi:hypothetical protein